MRARKAIISGLIAAGFIGGTAAAAVGVPAAIVAAGHARPAVYMHSLAKPAVYMHS